MSEPDASTMCTPSPASTSAATARGSRMTRRAEGSLSFTEADLTHGDLIAERSTSPRSTVRTLRPRRGARLDSTSWFTRSPAPSTMTCSRGNRSGSLRSCHADRKPKVAAARPASQSEHQRIARDAVRLWRRRRTSRFPPGRRYPGSFGARTGLGVSLMPRTSEPFHDLFLERHSQSAEDPRLDPLDELEDVLARRVAPVHDE